MYFIFIKKDMEKIYDFYFSWIVLNPQCGKLKTE